MLIVGFIVGALAGFILGVFIGFSLFKRAGTWD
jgi:ABC-type nitrate/sulfonate/bicarbonate transport system permease component